MGLSVDVSNDHYDQQKPVRPTLSSKPDFHVGLRHESLSTQILSNPEPLLQDLEQIGSFCSKRLHG